MNGIIDILIWLNKPNNRVRLSEFEIDFITNSIKRCIEDINPIIEKVEREKRVLLYIESFKRNKRKE